MNGHGQNAASVQAGNVNLVQPAITVAVPCEIRCGVGLVEHGAAASLDGNRPGVREDQILALFGQHLKEGIGAVVQTGKGVVPGTACGVTAVGHIHIARTVRLAVPREVVCPLVDLEAVVRDITGIRSLLDRRRASIDLHLEVARHRIGRGLEGRDRLLSGQRPDHLRHARKAQRTAGCRRCDFTARKSRSRGGDVQRVPAFGEGDAGCAEIVVLGENAVGVGQRLFVEAGCGVVIQREGLRRVEIVGGKAGNVQVRLHLGNNSVIPRFGGGEGAVAVEVVFQPGVVQRVGIGRAAQAHHDLPNQHLSSAFIAEECLGVGGIEAVRCAVQEDQPDGCSLCGGQLVVPVGAVFSRRAVVGGSCGRACIRLDTVSDLRTHDTGHVFSGIVQGEAAMVGSDRRTVIVGERILDHLTAPIVVIAVDRIRLGNLRGAVGKHGRRQDRGHQYQNYQQACENSCFFLH